MGMHFGELGVKVRGIITYSLSPFEQKAFGGIISRGVPNTIRRIRGQIFRVAPPFIIAYLVYDWGKKENMRLTRKDPNAYKDDQ